MPLVLLAVTTAGLAVGGGLSLAGDTGEGNAAWLAAAVVGAGYVVWAMIDALRHGRVGV